MASRRRARVQSSVQRRKGALITFFRPSHELHVLASVAFPMSPPMSAFTLTRRQPCSFAHFSILFLFPSFLFFSPVDGWMRHATGAPVLRTLDGAGKKALTAVSQLPPLSYIHTWWTALHRARTRPTRPSVRYARAHARGLKEW